MDNLLELNTSELIEQGDGSIVIFVQSEESGTRSNNALTELPPVTKKPTKTRALVYMFFDWDEESSRYKCKLCEYV